MRVQIYHRPIGQTEGDNISETVRLEGFRISQGFLGETSELQMSVVALASSPVPVSHWDQIDVNQVGIVEGGSSPESLFGDVLFGEAMFGGAGTAIVVGVKIFSGHVVKVRRVPFRPGPTAYVNYQITVVDFMILLDRARVVSKTYTVTADDTVIADLFTTYLPEIDTSNVSNVANVSIELKNVTLREALRRIVDQTKAHFYLSSDKELFYYAPSATPAALSLGEVKDEGNLVFGFDIMSLTYEEEFATPANKVTVLGALISDIDRYTATVQDVTSQGTYGVLERVIVDERINSTAEATAVAAAHITEFANPRKEGQITFWADGVSVGELLTITAPTYGVDGDFRIHRLELTWDRSKTRTIYRASFGEFRPDLIRTLRELSQLVVARKDQQISVPSEIEHSSGRKIRFTNGRIELVNTLGNVVGLVDADGAGIGLADAGEIQLDDADGNKAAWIGAFDEKTGFVTIWSEKTGHADNLTLIGGDQTNHGLHIQGARIYARDKLDLRKWSDATHAVKITVDGSVTPPNILINGTQVLTEQQTDPGSSPTTEELRQVLLAHGLIG